MRAAACGLVAMLLGACAAARLSPPGRQEELTLARGSPLSRTEEIARRTLTPLTFLHGQQALAAQGKALRDQPLDAAREHISLYVPGGPPPAAGYGVLVFVAPWGEATRPLAWRNALDKRSMLFVSAANSGNDENVLERRLPLALLAYQTVRARYPIDSNRVYIGGLSGGSRVAELTALAYPDIFRGALLNAGSDPIGGEQGMHLPPADLFRQFQATRIVFATGEADEGNLRVDGTTRDSLRGFCVLNVEVRIARGLGHEPLDAPAMERALAALDQPAAPTAAADTARCNARLQEELDAKLKEVESALARGDRDGARHLLWAIDAHYAGFAGAAIGALEAKLAAQ